MRRHGRFPALWMTAALSMAATAPVATVVRQPPAAAPPAKYRALLDQYCVTCHNDRAKTANLSLQQADLAAVGDHSELWEKVVRKLRAGVMPPPDVRRPPLPEYEALRDWLEAEIDRKAATRSNPGAVGLHRLNRTEYANAIRDLLDLQIDVTTLLPPDDSARGFDNVAGSLTISPTLLEAYTAAATRIARTAIGFWKSPTEAAYIAPGDTSQNQHIEGLPFGTRGGMAVRHTFPSDGEYRFSVKNLGIGKFIPGEKLELLIDNELVAMRDYAGVGLSANNSSDRDGSIDISVPVKSGSHLVGVTFLAANYRPSLDFIRQYERKSLEDNPIPQIEYYPAIGIMHIEGPFHATQPEDSPSLRKVFTCHPANATQEGACAKEILSALMRRAYRRPVTPADWEWVQASYLEGHRDVAFRDGIELGLRRILASPPFLVRAEREPANIPAGRPYRITDLELASRLSFLI